MRRALILVPVVLSSLVLGAHLFRAGLAWLALAAAALPLLLIGRNPWPTRLLQLALAFGAVEWLRTLAALVERRQLLGQPYARLVAILAVVAGVTALSAYLAGRFARPQRIGSRTATL